MVAAEQKQHKKKIKMSDAALSHWRSLSVAAQMAVATHVGESLLQHASFAALFRISTAPPTPTPTTSKGSAAPSEEQRIAACVQHFWHAMHEWLFAATLTSSSSSSSSIEPDRSTALLAARHVGYGVRSVHYAAWRKLLLDAVQRIALVEEDRSPEAAAALCAAYSKHFDSRTAGVRGASKQIVKVSPTVKCRFLSRRKVILLHAFWEQVSHDVPRGALSRLFYDALRTAAPPIHAFVGKRTRDQALHIDAFRQLLGGLVERICIGLQNHSSLRILFEALLGVSATQYSSALFDAVGAAALACCAQAVPKLYTGYVAVALTHAFTLLSIELARFADPSSDDETSLYLSAQLIVSEQQVAAPPALTPASPSKPASEPRPVRRRDSAALLGLAWAPPRGSTLGDTLLGGASRSAALVLNATAPRYVQCPTYRVAEHLLRRAMRLVSVHAAACERFGASALHLARMHADFAVFVRDTRVLHAVRVQDYTHSERVAFFLNLYHALLLHVRILRADDDLLAPEHFHLFKYRVGKQELSLHAIEHGILRARSFPPLVSSATRPPVAPAAKPPATGATRVRSGSFIVAAAAASSSSTASTSDAASRLPTAFVGALKRAEPLITFALSHCARSCPPIRVYRAERLHELLEHSTREYLDEHVVVRLPSDDGRATRADAAADSGSDSDDDDGAGATEQQSSRRRSAPSGAGTLLAPRLLHWYGRDFAATPEALIEWIAAHVGERQRRDLNQLRASDENVCLLFRSWRSAFAFRVATEVLPAPHDASAAVLAIDDSPRRVATTDDGDRRESLTRATSATNGGDDSGGGALRRAASVMSPSKRRSVDRDESAELFEAKQRADSELAVYLLTLQAKTDKLGARARHDVQWQAFHRLRTVATEVLNTPARDYASSPLAAAHDADLGELFEELRGAELASPRNKRASRDMSLLLRRSTSAAVVRRRADESSSGGGGGGGGDGGDVGELSAEGESLAELPRAAQRDLFDSLNKLRSVRAALAEACNEFVRAVAQQRQQQLALRRKQVRSAGALSEAVRQSVRFLCRICERTLHCSGAQFERHSRVCALGHTLANDSRLSRDERLVKLMSMARAMCGVGEAELASSDATEALVGNVERVVHATLQLPYGGAAAAADCARLVGELRQLLESRDAPLELAALGHCMCELLSHKVDFLAAKGDARRSVSGFGASALEAARVARASAGSGSGNAIVSIEDFKMLKPISKGGYGTVFLASKRATGDLYAIKMMKKEDLVHKNVVEQVLAERDIMASSNNPFVVKLFYALETEQHLYLVMEFIIGGDCAALLENLGAFDESMTRVYAAQIVCALEYLHAKAIVHRDLKPDNLLITAQGHIVLTDFGLSSWGADAPTVERRGSEHDSDSDIDVSEPQSLRSSLSMLRSAIEISEDARWDDLNESDVLTAPPPPPRILGTPHYLAPEMILQRPHHFGVDWWALGIIVFEFLAGVTPFDGDTVEAIMRNILHAQIPWSLLPDGTSPAAQSFIAALLRRDDDARLGARGARIVKRHAFFAAIEWSTLLEAATGFQPVPDSETDTSYFLDHGASAGSSAHTSRDISESDDERGTSPPPPAAPATPPPAPAPVPAGARASPLAQHSAGPEAAVESQPSTPPAASPAKDRVAALKTDAIQTRARSGSSPPRFKLAREFQFVNVTSLEEQNTRARKTVEDGK